MPGGAGSSAPHSGWRRQTPCPCMVHGHRAAGPRASPPGRRRPPQREQRPGRCSQGSEQRPPFLEMLRARGACFCRSRAVPVGALRGFARRPLGIARRVPARARHEQHRRVPGEPTRFQGTRHDLHVTAGLAACRLTARGSACGCGSPAGTAGVGTRHAPRAPLARPQRRAAWPAASSPWSSDRNPGARIAHGGALSRRAVAERARNVLSRFDTYQNRGAAERENAPIEADRRPTCA